MYFIEFKIIVEIVNLIILHLAVFIDKTKERQINSKKRKLQRLRVQKMFLKCLSRFKS